VLRMPDDEVRKVAKQKWRNPMDGWVKLNTDAAFCEGWGTASVGVVIRDSAGKVILSAWRVIRGCASAEQAEAEACLEGLRLVADWVQQPTCLESDCSNLIRDVQLKVNPRAPSMQRSGR
jgi:ribonuclease HI